MKRTGTKKGVGVGKIIKLVVAVMMCMVVLVNFTFTTKAAMVFESTTDMNKQYTNIYSMYTPLTVTEGVLWWKKNVTYTMSAKFNRAVRIMVDNLSDTWEWKGSKSKISSLDIGVSEQVTVSSVKSYNVALDLGLKVPVKSVEISGKLGGSYTNSKTFSKTSQRSAEIHLDRNSAAGYYAVIAAVNADIFNESLTKNGKQYTSGKVLKFANPNLYKKVHYSRAPF